MSDGQFIERGTLDYWHDRDQEQRSDIKRLTARIEELEAKVMKASNAALLEKRRADAAEAKLAKAVKMAYEPCPFGYGTEGYYDWWYNRHKLLAELKGETDA
jgi:hypothetical protein